MVHFAVVKCNRKAFRSPIDIEVGSISPGATLVEISATTMHNGARTRYTKCRRDSVKIEMRSFLAPDDSLSFWILAIPMKTKPDNLILHAEPLSLLVRKLIFPLWAIRDHPGFYGYFREFEKNQFLTRQQIQELQLSRVKELLEHAYVNCPFYRQRADEADLQPGRINSLEDFQRFPELTKQDLQDFGSSMLAGNIPASARVRNQTGGSTGSPLQFYVDRKRLASRAASSTRHNLWAGFRPGDWCAYLWGARLDQIIQPGITDWLKNILLYRRLELNTSQIRPADWDRFTRRLRQRRPRFMVAYALSAVQFGRYLQEHGISDIRFKAIITTAEVLLPEQRRLLEATFGARVFNRYGCRELSVIASECEHQQMHVNADTLLVEIIDGGRSDECGRIVITDLLNYSMPLIRYDIGDVGAWAEAQSCACGRGLPILAEVRGRTTDFLIMPDGTQISGPALTLVIADMPQVRQVQFVQSSANRVVLRAVPGPGYSELTRSELRQRLSLYLQNRVDLTIEEVQEIRSAPSGKYRFVINEVEATQTFLSSSS